MTRLHQPEPHAQHLDANGLRFGFLSWGEGIPVLALHGFPDSAHSWKALGEALAPKGYQLIAPFMRGYAPTALPPRDTALTTLGTDVVELARAFGKGKPIRVIGHDWGAEAVHAAVAFAPEAFSHAVTIAIPHRGALTPTPKLLWALRHFITLTLPGAARRFADDDYAQIEMFWKRWSPLWKYSAEELEAVKNVFAAPGVSKAALGYYRAASMRTPAALKEKIRVPFMAIAGADDPVATPALYEQARSMFAAHYEVATIPGGHFCHRESPDLFARHLERFFSP